MSIEVKNLEFSYGARKVLDDISFSAAEGEFLSILGENGVGKSTLFKCMLGLNSDYSGDVLINGKNIRNISPRAVAEMAAYIPQSCSPAFNFSVEDIVLMGASGRIKSFAMPGKKDIERAHWALQKLGIETLSKRCFHHLSGGERQLVTIARALVQNAGILLLDEPTASLDYGNQIQVLSQVRELANEGYTVIQTTHDPETAYMFSDRVIAIKNGRILVDDEPKNAVIEENISKLYGIEVTIKSLYDDKVRCCTPRDVIGL